MKEYYYILLENISSHKDSIEGALFFTTEEAELEWNFNGEQLTQFLNEIKKASPPQQRLGQRNRDLDTTPRCRSQGLVLC